MPTSPPIDSRRERKKAQRLSDIYETALDLFDERGFGNVTVDEIAEVVDISKGTFFNYFATKEEVLLEFQRRIYDEMYEFAERLNGESGVELFFKYFRKLSRIIQRNDQRYRMLYRVAGVRAKIRETGQDLGCRVFVHYQRFVLIAVEAGEVPEDTDPTYLAEFIRDLWYGNIHSWVIQQPPRSLDGSMRRKLEYLFDFLCR